MASPNKNPDYTAQIPKSGHDLSFDLGFTASTGMLLPIFTDFLLPGDTVQGSVNLFTQLRQPLAQPAQIEVEQIVDYFFVPFTMLYQPFENMKYQTPDAFRSNFPIQSDVDWTEVMATQFPKVNMARLCKTIHTNRNNWLNHMESEAKAAYRLMDLFGYNPDAILVDGVSGEQQQLAYTPNFFPYAALAYQCVYQYFYRLDQWEKFTNLYFNFDRFFGSNLLTEAQTDTLRKVFDLHYRPLYLDYFTNIKNSPLMSNVNVLKSSSDDSDTSSLRYLIDFKKYLSDDSYSVLNPSGNSDLGFPWTSVGADDSFQSAASIRNMFAAEKFLQITARAANRYDDQVLAHLGFKIPNDPKHNIQYLGTQKQMMNTTQVISTGDADALGDRVGQMYGSISGKDGFKFTAPVHGVVIGIYSALPKRMYAAGIDRAQVFTDIHDIFDSEYDHLGMQPLFGYEASRLQDNTHAGTILGWQWRYEQYKRKYSRCTSAFLRYMKPEDGYDTAYENYLGCFFNIQRPFCWDNALTPLVPSYVQGYWDFLCKPFELDTMQALFYETTWNNAWEANPALLYTSDPFIIDAHINLKKSSVMSVHSMPNLNQF